MPAQLRVFTPQRLPRKSTGASAKHAASEIFRGLGIVRDRAELVKQIQHGLAVTVIATASSESFDYDPRLRE